ncbi:dTMP kinase [Natronolimnohabitans innermongolicus]|uniref:dTMP kinase n=1 Tax=Natronolimnohabitans innermongolicus JCM 12255 TaxID=1227499 RepID=L9XKG4_9EURY|nr:thymidylate kinase [Natronolimnohabitans innermongolicus]ELY61123.1 thymidylate kinase [Natronolimnohabitans innermongolicus JCM 12255]
MIVVFTGVDGSGKTTQAERLRDALRERGIDARYEHLTGPNLSVTRKLKDRVGEAFLDREDEVQLSDGGRESSKSGGSKTFQPMGLFFLYRGTWQSWYNVVANRDADVIILDRYLYDDLVRVNWKYRYNADWLAKLRRLVPDPDLVFWLDTRPDVAWERESDGRTTLEQHERKKACVDAICRRVLSNSTTVPIDTSEQSIEDVHSEVLTETLAAHTSTHD